MANNSKKPLQSPENYIRTKARSLPIYKCYINSDWEKSSLANIFVLRKHSNQNITCGVYLVDMMCLGIKDSFYYFNYDENKFLQELLKGFSNFVSADYNLVHNIIFGALAFADDYGFAPAKEWKVSQYILEEDDDHIPIIDLEFGDNGVPVYYVGPNDDENKIKLITNTLKRTAGEGNYLVMSDDDDVYDQEENLSDENFPFEPGDLERIDRGEQEPDIYQYYFVTKQLYVSETQMPDVLAEEEIRDESLVSDDFFHPYVVDEQDEMDIQDEIADLIDTDEALEGVKNILEDFPDNPVVLTAYYNQFLVVGKPAPKEISKKLEKDFPDYLAFKFTKAYFMLQEGEIDEAYELLGSSLTLKRAFPNRNVFSIDEWDLFNSCMCVYFAHTGKLNMALCYAKNLEFNAFHFEDTKPLTALLILSGKMAAELRENMGEVF